MLKVYLVEDDPLVSRHVRDTLNEAPGIRCVGHASRLSIARIELPQCRPDVLLSDLGLPDGDGTELIGELSHAPASEGVWHPHILVFSVFGDEARVIHAIEAGADGYFLKGCTADELVRAVQQAARGESPISPAIARHLLKRFKDDGYTDSSFRDSGFHDSDAATLSGIMDFSEPKPREHVGEDDPEHCRQEREQLIATRGKHLPEQRDAGEPHPRDDQNRCQARQRDPVE